MTQYDTIRQKSFKAECDQLNLAHTSNT